MPPTPNTRPSGLWLADLYDAHYDALYAYAYRRTGGVADAQDIVATVFFDLVRHLRAGKGLEPPVEAWLFTVASRRVADYWRQRARAAARQRRQELGGAADTAPSPHAHAEQRLQLDLLHAAMLKLDAPDRQVIDLCYFGELDHATVALHLATAPANVAVRLHRAIKRLGKHYRALSEEGNA